jgi:D-3-phosphoglycerate dehydrogenase
MDKIFTSADIVTLHIPLDGHTRFMVNSDYLQSFVRNIFLLNLSRGEIVNTLDVLNGIRNGKILGFGADVLEHEDPLQMGDTEKKWFEELIQLDQVVLTPHVAGWTQESLLGIARVLGEKIVLNTALVKG